MLEERRKSPRVPAHARVYFGNGNTDHIGFAADVSHEGIRILARKAYPKETAINLRIDIPDRGWTAATGVVRRARRIEPRIPPHEPMEMGVAIAEGVHHLKNYALSIAERFTDHRLGLVRHEVHLAALVGDGVRLVEEFTQNIGDGGMFVVSENPPLLGELLPIRLRTNNGAGEIRAMAQVAHVVSPESATTQGRVPGYGLRFEYFEDDGESRYRAILALARGPTPA
ncbi:PilZ domain-containing protein [bacterium]|nr:PilZ domain-containing protein [bacterium]